MLNFFSPYLYLIRIHRPLPILLLMWPTLWALLVANQGAPSFKLLIIFVLGVFFMRSAGCILNDICDRNFDGDVERTKFRPLVSGEITIPMAILTAFVLILLSFFLVLQLNLYSISLSLVALVLAFIYPLCKRFFFMPQIILGMAFNFGVVMAYAASNNHIPLNAFILYLAAIVWTISYDTIYALSDLKYDLKIGLHSSAKFFGKYVVHLIIFFQFLFICLLFIFGYCLNYNYWFYSSLLFTIPFFIFEFYLYRQVKIKTCIAAFSNNHWIGFVVLLAFLTQYL